MVAACSNDDGSALDAAGDGAGKEAGVFPNKPGGNPLVPEVAAYPFPSDFYLVEDATTATGRRVSIPAEALPKGLTPDLFDDLDGFTRMPAILAYLPGGVDAKSLPDPLQPELTIAKDSPAFLVREKTWEKVPILIETDLTTPMPKNRALIIRPLKALDFDAGYVVVLRDELRSPDGTPHAAGAAFTALRDGVKTGDPAVEQQRGDFELVRKAIDELGLAPKEVVLAWPFHTRSEESVTRTLLAMHDIVNKAPLGAYKIIKDQIDTQGSTSPRENRQIAATFKVPNFVDPKTTEIKLDANGAPIQLGETDVSFGITVPLSIDKPRPVILYGHGFFGHWIQGTRGSFNELCHEGEFSAVSSNIGFNSDNEALALTAFADLSKFRGVVATNLQTFVNFTALARLVKEKLADDITIQTSGGATVKVFDPNAVHYMGISNGGTFGLVVAATSPQLERAALIVGGGGLSHFLQRAVQWNAYGALFRLAYTDALERQLVLSLMQHSVDEIDSINYVSRLVKNRFPGRKPLKAALHMAVHDCQVNNMITEWVARTADLPLITPSAKQIYGLSTITAAPPDGAPPATAGALFVYDEKVEPTPVGNVPPKTDNGTHGSVRSLKSYKAHVAKFIDEGKLVQVCSGPCDPE
jgi:pimeloyl-ACP methyl ester carboxylesterase